MPLFSTGPSLLDISLVFYITYSVSTLLAQVASIGILIVSLIYCWRRGAPRYMRGLPLYFFVSDLTEVLVIIFRKGHYIYVYGAFMYIDTLYLLYFFSLLLGSSLRRSLWAGIFIVLIPSLAFYFYTKRLWGAVAVAAELESIVLIIPCMIFYRRLFERPKIAVLEKDPGFWMVTGIFFYFFIRFPVIWFTGYYHLVDSQPFSAGVYSINNYSLVISYALFTKAMVCLTK